MEAPSTRREPTVAAASPARWRAWLRDLVLYGKKQLAALGLALTLGFAGALLALYLFALLADDVMEQETEQLDTMVLLALRQLQSPTLDLAARVISAFGAEILAVLLVVLLGVFAWQRRWGAAAGLLVTVVGAQLLNNVLKDWFHRTRPAPVEGFIPAQAFSFPSGHAMVAVAFYILLGYIAWRLLRGWKRAVCVGGLAVLVLLIGLSRLYLGVHYLTDVLAGYAAGFAWADAVIIGGRLIARRRPAPADLAAGEPPPAGATLTTVTTEPRQTG
jgi:membrane-associated phospholipid phosphatase